MGLNGLPACESHFLPLAAAKMLIDTLSFLVSVCSFRSTSSASFLRSNPSEKICKVTPLSPSWPSKSAWDTFNVSISGQLLAPLPPAAVCDPSQRVFNEASCEHVASLWNVSDFHATDPVSVDQVNWENDACLPSLGKRCNLKQFPRYVVNATESMHVKKAVDFARERSIRLIVKGTGHDYLGRYALALHALLTRYVVTLTGYEDQRLQTPFPSGHTIFGGCSIARNFRQRDALQIHYLRFLSLLVTGWARSTRLRLSTALS